MPNKYNPKIHNRHSIRLPEYDYSQDGWYYITLCVLGNKCIFGKYTDGVIQLYQYGRIVEKCWKWLAQQYSYVHLDEYVVMPNHLHGIIIVSKGGSRTAPHYQLEYHLENSPQSTISRPNKARTKLITLYWIEGGSRTAPTICLNRI